MKQNSFSVFLFSLLTVMLLVCNFPSTATGGNPTTNPTTTAFFPGDGGANFEQQKDVPDDVGLFCETNVTMTCQHFNAVMTAQHRHANVTSAFPTCAVQMQHRTETTIATTDSPHYMVKNSSMQARHVKFVAATESNSNVNFVANATNQSAAQSNIAKPDVGKAIKSTSKEVLTDFETLILSFSSQATTNEDRPMPVKNEGATCVNAVLKDMCQDFSNHLPGFAENSSGIFPDDAGSVNFNSWMTTAVAHSFNDNYYTVITAATSATVHSLQTCQDNVTSTAGANSATNDSGSNEIENWSIG